MGEFVSRDSPVFAISLLRAFAVIPITMLKSPFFLPFRLSVPFARPFPMPTASAMLRIASRPENPRSEGY